MRTRYVVAVAFFISIILLFILLTRVAKGPGYARPFVSDVDQAFGLYFELEGAYPVTPVDEKFKGMLLRQRNLEFRGLSLDKNLYCVRVRGRSDWLIFEYFFVGTTAKPRIEPVGFIQDD